MTRHDLQDLPFIRSTRRLIRDLNTAGFHDHLAVRQYPGPNGVRPSTLARSSDPDEGRKSVVWFTERGHAVYARILEILDAIENEWAAEVGKKEFEKNSRPLGPHLELAPV